MGTRGRRGAPDLLFFFSEVRGRSRRDPGPGWTRPRAEEDDDDDDDDDASSGGARALRAGPG